MVSTVDEIKEILKNPKLRFHYLPSKYGFIDLKESKIKVCTFDSLNDPFELLPNLNHEPDKRRIRRNIFKAFSYKWGLLCFTDSWRRQLLWAHYADSYKGIALGFEISTEELKPIEYLGKNRLILNPANENDINEENCRRLAFNKSNDWEKENEYRLLVKLSDCENDGSNYFISFGDKVDANNPFGKNLILKVILLGSRFPRTYYDYVTSLAINHKVKIAATRLSWTYYDVNICGMKTNILRDKQIEKLG